MGGGVECDGQPFNVPREQKFSKHTTFLKCLQDAFQVPDDLMKIFNKIQWNRFS